MTITLHAPPPEWEPDEQQLQAIERHGSAILTPWSHYEPLSSDGETHLAVTFDGGWVELHLSDREHRETFGFSAADMERLWRIWNEWRVQRVRDI